MPYRDVRAARKFVGQLLEHDPSTIDTREMRVDLMNIRYLAINEAEDWLFLETEVDWKVWYNRTGANTGFTVAVTNGSHAIQFSSALGTSYTNDAAGMEFVDDQGDTYTINRFTSQVDALLDNQYAGPTNAAMTDWEIKAERFYLPVDCARALSFVQWNTEQSALVGPMVITDRRFREQNLSWTPQTEGTIYWIVDDDTRSYRAPDPGYVAVESTAAGTLASSSTYEVCYTFTLQGIESPPSVPIRVEMSVAANHQIVITGMENTSDGGSATGIYKNVYIRRLTSSNQLPAGDFYSRWLLAATLTEATTTLTITSFPIPQSTQLTYQNGRKYMRTEWAPQQDQTIRLRYLIKPPRLVADSDAPSKWPEAFHDLITYGAAIDLGLSQGAAQGKLDRWQKAYDDLYAKMKSTQLIVPNSPTVKRQRRDGVGYGLLYYTAGNPTTDYNG